MPFSVGQTLLFTLSGIVDSGGHPTTFKAPPVWSSSDVTVVNPVAAADGLSAVGTALKTGSVVITVVGDGVTRTLAIDISAGDVVDFKINVAVAPPGPPPPPPPPPGNV